MCVSDGSQKYDRPMDPIAPPGSASIYVRLSREAQADNLSKQGMEDDCRALASRHGLTVVAVHVDDGISGAVRNRPQFTEWLDDAREGRADTLITWAVDRLTREGINAAAMILDVVEGKDPETGREVRPRVRLLDVDGLDSDGDPTSFRFSLAMKAEIARAERDRMRDRARAAHRRMLEAGRHRGGVVPYGFRAVPHPDGSGKVLEVDPYEAEFVREAARRILSGESMLSVTRWANRESGHRPRRSDVWRTYSLRNLLIGPATGGYVVRRAADGELTPVIGPDGEAVRIPAVLEEDVYAAVRATLTAGVGSGRSYARTPVRLLSGLLTCRSCGAVMRVAKRQDGKPVYRCMRDANMPGVCTRRIAITAEPVDEYVSEWFLDTFGDLPEYERRIDVRGAADLAAANAAVSSALTELGHSATPEAFEALQAAQRARTAAEEVARETEESLVPTGRTLGAAWIATDDIPRRRDILAANVSHIIVGPGVRRNGIDPARLEIVTVPGYVDGVSVDGNPVAFKPGMTTLPGDD